MYIFNKCTFCFDDYICDKSTKIHIFNIDNDDDVLKCQCKLILNDDEVYDAYLVMGTDETCTLKECDDDKSYIFKPFESKQVETVLDNKLFKYMIDECRISKIILYAVPKTK